MGTWGGSDEVPCKCLSTDGSQSADLWPTDEYTTGYRMAVDFYHSFRRYTSELTNTNIKSVEDIVAYNIEYNGEGGGLPGTLPGL